MQAQDTIYIYEEEIIYDTVYEYVEKRVNPFEEAATLHTIRPSALQTNPNLLIFSQKAVTFPTISEWEEPTDSSQRLHLFDFIAENSTLDMFMGIGAWASIVTPMAVKNHWVWNQEGNATISFGVNYDTKFISRLTLGTGASIHFLGKNESLKGKLVCTYPDCDYCKGDEATINIFTFFNEDLEKDEGYTMRWNETESGQYEDSVGLKEADSKYVMFAVPVRLGFRIGKFNPYGGLEYNIRMAMDNDLKDLHSLGFITGMRVDINHRFAVSSNFYAGLTNDMTHTGSLYRHSDGTRVRTDKYNWHSFRFELMGHFKF